MHDSYFMALNCFCWCYWPRWPGKGWPEEIPWQAVHAQPPLLPQWGWREFLGEGSKLRSHNLPCLLQSRSTFFPWWEKGTWALGRLFWESFAMELAIPCPWFPPAGCRIGLIATSQCVPQDLVWQRHPVGSVVKSNLFWFFVFLPLWHRSHFTCSFLAYQQLKPAVSYTELLLEVFEFSTTFSHRSECADNWLQLPRTLPCSLLCPLWNRGVWQRRKSSKWQWQGWSQTEWISKHPVLSYFQ